MKDKYCIIKIKDSCNYDDDFEYDPIIVVKDDNFEKKYSQLEKIVENYETFQDIEDFIHENFETIEIEEREIYC